MVSIFPCDVHGRRVLTRLGSAYITLARGSTKRSRKLRLCSPCLGDILKTYGEHWTEVDLDDEIPLAEVCASCQEAVPETKDREILFVTTYERGDDRRDFFAYYCPMDATSLAGALGLN